MANFEYSVKLANGKVATRKSHRTYTHVVAVNGHHPTLLKGWRERDLKNQEQHIAHYENLLSGKEKLSAYESKFEVGEWLREAQERLVELKAIIAAGFPEPTIETQGVLTWCGRYDLALKQAASAQKEWVGVEILPVEVREIKKRVPAHIRIAGAGANRACVACGSPLSNHTVVELQACSNARS